jgi:hypothetical protein
MWWLNGGGTMLRIGEEEFDLRSAASQAIELAEVVERVRAEYLRRAETRRTPPFGGNIRNWMPTALDNGQRSPRKLLRSLWRGYSLHCLVQRVASCRAPADATAPRW